MKTRELIAHLTLLDPSGDMPCVASLSGDSTLMRDANVPGDIRKGLVRRSRFGTNQYVERDPTQPAMAGDSESLEVIVVGS